jgi:hypothetical protein
MPIVRDVQEDPNNIYYVIITANGLNGIMYYRALENIWHSEVGNLKIANIHLSKFKRLETYQIHDKVLLKLIASGQIKTASITVSDPYTSEGGFHEYS